MLFRSGGPIAWSSRRQHCISISSTESEYHAASTTALDAIYHRRILEDLGHKQVQPTVLFEDNMATVHISNRDGAMKRLKHIDTRVHKLRELVREGVIKLVKIATANQVADALTKALSFELFDKQRSVMMDYVTQ